MPEIRVSVSDLLNGTSEELERLRTGNTYDIVVVHKRADMLEVDDKHFRTDSAVPHIEDPEKLPSSAHRKL